MKRFLAVTALAALFALLACHPLPAQDVVRITIGDQDFERAEPETMDDALTLIRGETDLLNKVIAAYITDGAAAQANVEELLRSVSTVAVKAREVVPVAPPVQLPPVTVTVTIPAKTLAVGAFLEANPLPLVGGLSIAAGISASINVFNSFIVGSDAGFNITTSSVAPVIRLRGEYWLF